MNGKTNINLRDEDGAEYIITFPPSLEGAVKRILLIWEDDGVCVMHAFEGLMNSGLDADYL